VRIEWVPKKKNQRKAKKKKKKKEAFMPFATVFYQAMKLKFGVRVLLETV
jgi:hypothetical protein